MKKLLLVICLLISGFFYGSLVNAQVKLNVNVNIGSQPVWGPVGYDYAQYYYLPDADAYYSIPNHQYIYQNGGRWVFASALPGRYNYDPYRSYKVVVNDPKPYLHPDIYRNKYGRYKGQYDQQQIIRDSRDEKYYAVKGHPMNGRGNQRKYNGDNNQGHGNGNDNSQGHGNNGHGNGHGNGNDNGQGHGHNKD
ncbi:hypothetical protein CLV51_104442 [Chitinophaga niastensis]|uniref:Uncharacterized protein n=1 Tax=Chitinophaga niastensis TaxID=536980 RepID=A0A2P8HHN6_CHINA|nr:hypothetical protein [Chitinophaga niastensis]PSL45735.1 hypothetical protein CLV51_104442 [Chitinophaga niastensis]